MTTTTTRPLDNPKNVYPGDVRVHSLASANYVVVEADGPDAWRFLCEDGSVGQRAAWAVSLDSLVQRADVRVGDIRDDRHGAGSYRVVERTPEGRFYIEWLKADGSLELGGPDSWPFTVECLVADPLVRRGLVECPVEPSVPSGAPVERSRMEVERERLFGACEWFGWAEVVRLASEWEFRRRVKASR